MCIVGHTQRGGSPTTLDRKIASEMGFLAVKQLHEGISHKMIVLINNQLKLIQLPTLDTPPRTLSSKDLIELNNVLCI